MKWFLRVEKVGERKKKEVDAKHLLFLWGEWTAKRLLVWFKGRVAVWHVGNGDLMMRWHECHLFCWVKDIKSGRNQFIIFMKERQKNEISINKRRRI